MGADQRAGFRRVVRARRKLAAGKCPTCNADVAPIRSVGALVMGACGHWIATLITGSHKGPVEAGGGEGA